jgi:hypothetical protein
MQRGFIQRGLEHPAEIIRRIPEKIKDGIFNRAANATLNRLGISSEITRENVAKASRQVEKFIGEDKSYGLEKVKADIVKGMYSDIGKQLKGGMSKREVMGFYASIPEFMSAWGKLGFGALELKAIIDESL